MVTDPVTLAKHAHDIAGAFDIDLLLSDYLGPTDGVAMIRWDGRRGVFARPITDERSYIVVMHELGHHLAPSGMLREPMRLPVPRTFEEHRRWVALQVEEERAAWEWARHHALCWTPVMTFTERDAYATYLKHFEELQVAA
jgi:hypothetical protein